MPDDYGLSAMDVSTVLDAPLDLVALQRDRPIALFLDFDGTLVDIAPRPDAIVLPVGLPGRLAELSARLDGRVALVSGRGIADLETHLGKLAIAGAGSHGSDCRLAGGEALGSGPHAMADSARDAVRSLAASHGFTFEDKPHGAALHFRSAIHLEPLALALATQLADAHGLCVKRGKCVVELVVPGADKGSAVRAFMAVAPFAGALPVFVGDDVTDEDGFVAATDLGGFGVLVGTRAPTVARYGLPDTRAVHEWLGL